MTLKRLLSEAPTEVVEEEFQRICVANVRDSYDDHSDLEKNYDNALLQAFTELSIEKKDGQRLTAILNHHCPKYIVYSALEFSMAYGWPGSLGLLFDCYATAKSPAVKQDIAFCLGRAFPDLRKRYTLDGEFIKEARTWYDANISQVQINTQYPHLPARLPTVKPIKDLFVPKSK